MGFRFLLPGTALAAVLSGCTVMSVGSEPGPARIESDGLIEGHANKVIAYDLDISARTVEVYRANVMTKMQAHSLSELVRMVTIARLGGAG